jgi:hypothetical protein
MTDNSHKSSLTNEHVTFVLAVLVILVSFMLGVLGLLGFAHWYLYELPELVHREMLFDPPPVGSLEYCCIAIPGYYEVHRWLPVAGLVVCIGFITSSVGLFFNYRWAWWTSLISFFLAFVIGVIDMVFNFRAWSLAYDPHTPSQGIGNHAPTIGCGCLSFIIYAGAVTAIMFKWPSGRSIFDLLFRSRNL